MRLYIHLLPFILKFSFSRIMALIVLFKNWGRWLWAKVLAAKPDVPTMSLGTHVVERRTNSCKLTSDLHMCVLWCTQ